MTQSIPFSPPALGPLLANRDRPELTQEALTGINLEKQPAAGRSGVPGTGNLAQQLRYDNVASPCSYRQSYTPPAH